MELKRLTLLLLTIGLCHCQSESDSVAPTTSSSMAATTITPVVSSSVAPPDTTILVPTPPPTVDTRPYNAMRRYRDTAFYAAIYDRTYSLTQGSRWTRFNCHVRNAAGVITNRVPSERVLTMYLHMPVLHFLDANYKESLMTSLAGALSLPVRAINGDPTSQPTLCIDGHDQAFVSEFEEGIMLRVYHNAASPMSGQQMYDTFTAAVRSRTPATSFTTFLGRTALNYSNEDRDAIVIRTFRPPGRYSINQNTDGNCRQLAADMNSYDGAPVTNLECVTLSRSTEGDIKDSVPDNPDPVNYYLEAGDIVFSVFGAFAVAIVLALTLLGYFIHPFFLA